MEHCTLFVPGSQYVLFRGWVLAPFHPPFTEWPLYNSTGGPIWVEPFKPEGAMPFYFYLDDDHKLGWGTTESKPTLTEQQAMIVAVANMATALENIGLQIHQAIDPLQEIADKHGKV
jgi:hypothetical protein